MTADAAYRNYRHYLSGRPGAEPKRYFADALALLDPHLPHGGTLLDVGCAAGGFLNYVGLQRPDVRCVGVDVFDELLASARSSVPGAEFVNASALDLPSRFDGSFDAVTALGLLGIFPLADLGGLFDELLRCVLPGGRLLVFSPFNEFGVDIEVRHRKRMEGRPGPWELGWNVYAQQTISEIVAERSSAHRFIPFELGMTLEPMSDPVRTWTLPTVQRPHQLVNGLKLLIDLYFLEISTRA